MNCALSIISTTQKAVRGKYYKRLIKEGANVVVLDPDIAENFPDSASVNAALRSFLGLGHSIDPNRDARG